MKYNREELLNALQKLIPATSEANMGVDGMDSFVFDSEAIHTYNDSLSITVQYKTGLEGAVKAKDLFKLLSKVKTTEIDIEPEDGFWTISAGGTKAKINLKEDQIRKYLNTLPLDGEFKPLPENFFNGLKLCRISGNSSYLRGIYVQGSDMVATDEIRLNYFTLAENMDPFWVDDSSINELLKLKEGMTEYHVSGGWVLFRGDSGTIFSCRKNQDSSYPYDKLMEYKTMFVKADTDIEQVLPRGFSDMTDRVGVMYEDVNGFHAVSVHMRKEGFTLSSKTDAGMIKESGKWDKPFDSEIDITFKADFEFLSDIAEKCPEFYLRQTEGYVDIVFSNPEFMQVMKTIAE